MKTQLLSISLAFSLMASAQVLQFAINGADDKAGTRLGKIFDSDGTLWN